MKKLAFVFALSIFVAGVAMAVDPVSVMTGERLPVLPGAENRDICWSQTYNLNGYKITSEIIAMYGLESELASDFIVCESGDATITATTAWGGYYNWAGEEPNPLFNLKFYDDYGCYPSDVAFFSFIGVAPTRAFIGYDGFGYPTYSYRYAGGPSVMGGALYWFGFQCADHTFPPQFGRQEAASFMNCDTMFKSAYFGYPAWTPASALVGFAWDASSEIECTCGPSATTETTWGAIKGLYR